jgi:hypothetical protein
LPFTPLEKVFKAIAKVNSRKRVNAEIAKELWVLRQVEQFSGM